MKNFDEARNERASLERTFQIGGETFHYRPGVRPEEILPWFQMRAEEGGELTQEQQLGVYDDTVLAYLVPGQEKAWKKVRETAEPPVTILDMAELIDWLFEEQAARPTGQPSDSSSGSESGATTTNSKAKSSSQAAAA